FGCRRLEVVERPDISTHAAIVIDQRASAFGAVHAARLRSAHAEGGNTLTLQRAGLVADPRAAHCDPCSVAEVAHACGYHRGAGCVHGCHYLLVAHGAPWLDDRRYACVQGDLGAVGAGG